MSRGSHRSEPVGRLSRRGTRLTIAGGVTLALVGVALAVTFRPGTGSGSAVEAVEATQALTAADSGRADALIRADERAARSRLRSPLPTTSAPTPAPVPKVVGKRWVITAVNVRSGPSADADRVGSLKARAQVGVTGRTRTGWTQVVLDDRPGWVRSTFLSTSKPRPATPTGVSAKSCSISRSIEQHLTANARAVYRAVCATYGSTVASFGGYRAGDSGDHGSGRAVDIMVSSDPGKVIARYVQAHAGALNVTYVIYQQKIWMAGDPMTRWKSMPDRGSPTDNHYDHVHVSVS